MKKFAIIVVIILLNMTLFGCSKKVQVVNSSEGASEDQMFENQNMPETEIAYTEKNESKGEVAMYSLDSEKGTEQNTNSEAMSEEEVKIKIGAELKEIRKSLDEMPFETHMYDVIEKEIDSMGKVYFLNIVTVDKRMRSTLNLYDSEFNLVESFGKWQNGADILTVEVGDFNNDGLDDIYVNTYARGVDQSFEESKNDMRGQYGWFYLQTDTGEFYCRSFVDLTNIPRSATPYDIILVKEIWDEQSSLPRQILSDKNGYIDIRYDDAIEVDLDSLGKVLIIQAKIALGEDGYPIVYITNDKYEILRSFGKFDDSREEINYIEVVDMNNDGLKDIYVRTYDTRKPSSINIPWNDPSRYRDWCIYQTESGTFELRMIADPSERINQSALASKTNEKPAIQGKSITEPTQEEILSSNAPIESGISINSKSVVIECSGDVAMQAGMKVVIPPKRNRKIQRNYDKDLYRIRHLVENAFLHLKRWRGIATRYAKTTASFVAAVQIRCIALWLAVLT